MRSVNVNRCQNMNWLVNVYKDEEDVHVGLWLIPVYGVVVTCYERFVKND